MTGTPILGETEAASIDSVTASIVECVAATTARDALELPPLYDAVDPDALDALVHSASTPLTVQFTYAGCRVTVEDDGSVRCERERGARATDVS